MQAVVQTDASYEHVLIVSEESGENHEVGESHATIEVSVSWLSASFNIRARSSSLTILDTDVSIFGASGVR